MKKRRALLFFIVLVILALTACSGLKDPGAGSATQSPSAGEAITTKTPARELTFDNFEGDTTDWKAGMPPNYDDSSAKSVALTQTDPLQGKQSLELSFEKTDLPKAIFLVEKPLDLSQYRYLVFELSNPGTAASVAIAVCTGADWKWFESPPVALEDGKQTISFDLAGQNFKSAASGWQFTTGITGLGGTQRFVIILQPKATGSIKLDALRLSEAPVGKQPDVESLPTPTPVQPKPASFLKLKVINQPSQVYDLLELQVDTDGAYRNPFDPGEVDLQARFISPQGEVYTVPAFWYQDYDKNEVAQGQPVWHLRFTPWEPGSWTVQATLGSLLSEPLQVEVAGAQARGFVRVNPKNPNYFAFDDGTTYFPIGINMGWGSSNPLPDYQRWLDRLSSNGGNIIRVWMASWSFGLEWSDTGLGNYSRRLDRAWELDRVFRLAEESGVYVELVLINHGAFSATVNPEWVANPYNASNGGPCKNPEDFATNPQAREIFKRRLRYIAARWAYSPALMAWEWWNEADWTPISNKDHVSWIQEMTPVLRGYDPYHHLISTSFAKGSTVQVNSLPEIDFAQLHLYDSTDPAINFPVLFKDWSRDLPSKPIMFAEFGASAGGEDTRSDDQHGLNLHNGLWAATFSGFASGAMYWWWDTYVDPLNLWGLYGNLSRFLEGEDLAVLSPAKGVISNREIPYRILMNTDSALAWFHDRKFEVGALSREKAMQSLKGEKVGPDWTYLSDPISGVTLKLTGLKDGDYTAYWYSPFRGEWLSKGAVTVANGEVTLALPDFQGDLAVKILPASVPGPEVP